MTTTYRYRVLKKENLRQSRGFLRGANRTAFKPFVASAGTLCAGRRVAAEPPFQTCRLLVRQRPLLVSFRNSHFPVHSFAPPSTRHLVSGHEQVLVLGAHASGSTAGVVARSVRDRAIIAPAHAMSAPEVMRATEMLVAGRGRRARTHRRSHRWTRLGEERVHGPPARRSWEGQPVG